MNNIKEANNILAAAIYEPGIHGDKFRHKTARKIARTHISNTEINSNSKLADYYVSATVTGNVNIQDTRCMDLFNAKMSKLHSVSNNHVSFQVIQNRDNTEINYWYDISFETSE